jgi:hypothetical protein
MTDFVNFWKAAFVAIGGWRGARQAIRDEINRIGDMTDEEYYNAYPDEVEEKGGEYARTAADSE